MTNWQDHIKQRLESPLALLAILTVATLTLFIRGLLSSDPVVPSGTGTDLIEQFAYWRQFGFSQLRHGHIVLWNPYEYSGSPFLGGWQSGILYPPNFIYLFLPLAKAIDVEFILHIIWAGFGVALWSRYNRFDPFASLTAAFVTMFGGALFPHVYAGHLAPIDAMSWIPWIIFAVDQLLDRPNLRSTLLLTVSIAMSILAGHPQTVFFGFVAVSLYCVMRFVAAPHKMKSLAAFVAAGCWSVALTSMQIDAGLAADSEGVRRFGVPFDFAASFSFPPENLITFICPWFFGKIASYWGRCYIWEMCMFVGVAASLGIVYAIVKVPHDRKWSWSIIAGILMILALGVHTPLFAILYDYVPGFNKFRSDSKFGYDAIIFLSILAALGIDGLLKNPRGHTRFASCVGVTGAALIIIAVAMSTVVPAAEWQRVLHAVLLTHESYLPPNLYNLPVVVQETRQWAETSIAIAGATLCLAAVCLWTANKYATAILVLPVIAFFELFCFAHSSINYVNLDSATPPFAARLRAIGVMDNRVLIQGGYMDSGTQQEVSNLWGYDPSVLQRYAQFMAFTQGHDPNLADSYLNFQLYTPLYRLFRCTDIFTPTSSATFEDIAFPNTLPHVFFVQNYEVIANRDQILAAMAQPSFDPGKTMILEAPINLPADTSLPDGSASIVQTSPGKFVIHAENSAPALLAVTDVYSKFWIGTPMSDDSQAGYHVVPADYTILGIPLQAGRHVFSLDYYPAYFTQTEWVAALSAILLLLMAGLALATKNNKSDIASS